MRSEYPTGLIWGVLRNDLVDSPKVVAVSTDKGRTNAAYRQMLAAWKHGHFDESLKPVLITAELTWVPEKLPSL